MAIAVLEDSLFLSWLTILLWIRVASLRGVELSRNIELKVVSLEDQG